MEDVLTGIFILMIVGGLLFYMNSRERERRTIRRRLREDYGRSSSERSQNCYHWWNSKEEIFIDSGSKFRIAMTCLICDEIREFDLIAAPVRVARPGVNTQPSRVNG